MHEVCWRVDSSIRQLKPNNGHRLTPYWHLGRLDKPFQNPLVRDDEWEPHGCVHRVSGKAYPIAPSHRMAALYAGDPSFIPGVFVPMEKTSSVRGGERDRPSRTRYGPIPGRLVADIRVGEQSGKACHALRCGNLDDLGIKDEYTKFVGG